MKLAVFTNLLLAAPLISAQFDTVFALTKALGLTVKFDCALPCILEAANRIACSGKGPADTICSNIDVIAKEAKPCAEKCDADRASTFIQELTQYVCKQGVSGSGRNPANDKNAQVKENKDNAGNEQIKDKVKDQHTEGFVDNVEAAGSEEGKDEL